MCPAFHVCRSIAKSLEQSPHRHILIIHIFAGSSYFVWLNRGKESLVLDLREKQAVHHLDDLISRADVLVQNLKPGAMGRLGLSVELLRKKYPKLICCSISGYGDSGPLAQRKAYDLLVQAEAGLASITGERVHVRV